MARRPPCLAALSGQPPEPGGSRRKARGVDGESACRATMVSGHYAANVTTFFLIPLFPLKFRLRLFNRSKAEPFCFCDTRRINLYPVGTSPRTKVPLATVRGHRAPREDGTILYRGVFQPCWIPITHPTLELQSVRV